MNPFWLAVLAAITFGIFLGCVIGWLLDPVVNGYPKPEDDDLKL